MTQQRPAASPDAQDSAARGSPAGAASGAALLATFYVDQKKFKEVANRLQDLLRRGLNITKIRRDGWHTSPDWNEAFRRFEPRTHHPDATVLQVVLNPPGDVVQDWEALRRRLEGILEPEALDGIWGYTLVYQASLNPGFGPEEAFAKLRPSARLLHCSKGPHASRAQALVAGGKAWLLTVPTEGNGAEAGAVYVALSEPGKEGDLSKAFLGRRAGLMIAELIAHKSYSQIRQYRGMRHEEYKGHLKNFRELVRDLLNDLEQREVQSDEVSKLTRLYNKLAEMVWVLEDIRISMARQLHNYDEVEATKDNGILRYHRPYIQSANAELELLVGEGRYALGVADPVLSISRYRAEKARQERQQLARDEEERRQRRANKVIAGVGAAIGVPTVMNQQATAAFLAWPLNMLFGVRELNLDHNPHTLIVVAAQIVIIAAVAFLFYLFIRRLSGEPGEGPSGRE